MSKDTLNPVSPEDQAAIDKQFASWRKEIARLQDLVAHASSAALPATLIEEIALAIHKAKYNDADRYNPLVMEHYKIEGRIARKQAIAAIAVMGDSAIRKDAEYANDPAHTTSPTSILIDLLVKEEKCYAANDPEGHGFRQALDIVRQYLFMGDAAIREDAGCIGKTVVPGDAANAFNTSPANPDTLIEEIEALKWHGCQTTDALINDALQKAIEVVHKHQASEMLGNDEIERVLWLKIAKAMASSKQLGMTGYTDEATKTIMSLIRPYLREPKRESRRLTQEWLDKRVALDPELPSDIEKPQPQTWTVYDLDDLKGYKTFYSEAEAKAHSEKITKIEGQ